MSIGTPKRTLNNAVTCLKPSDTLLVRGGTYPEALIHTIPAGTSWSLPVTIKGYPGETAILRPPTGSVGVLRFVQPQQYIVIDSLILDGVNVTYDVVKVTLSGSDPSVHAHHIRVQNSELMNAPGQCVLTAGGHFNEFINNKIHDCGTTEFHHGLYISSKDNILDGNHIYRNSGWGVHQFHQGVYDADRNIIRNNKVYGNGTVGKGGGILIGSGTSDIAYNILAVTRSQGAAYDIGAYEFVSTAYSAFYPSFSPSTPPPPSPVSTKFRLNTSDTVVLTIRL